MFKQSPKYFPHQKNLGYVVEPNIDPHATPASQISRENMDISYIKEIFEVYKKSLYSLLTE